jgi:hypothetical protein
MSAQSWPFLIAVAHEARGDVVAVGLVEDQDAAEVATGLRVERFEERRLASAWEVTPL